MRCSCSLAHARKTVCHILGPLNKIPDSFLQTHFAFSREEGETKTYVQDKLRAESSAVV